MAVSQDRAVVLEGTQLGIETTPGALVQALRRLQSCYVEPAPNVPITMHRGLGSFVATGEVVAKEWTAANLSSADFSFRELIYLLAGVVGQPVGGGPITPTGAANTRRWTFRLINWVASNPQTYTFEHGQNLNGFAERFGYGLINTLACRTTDKDLAFSGQIIGQQTIEAVTLTQGGAAIAAPTVNPTLSATGTAASPIAAPTIAPGAAGGPTLTVNATGGTFAAGTYALAYTYTNAAGETTASPLSQFQTVGANGSISVGPVTIPSGATGVKWYASNATTSTVMDLVAGAPTNGSAWTLTAPGSGAAAPTTNTATAGGTTNLAAGSYSGLYTYADATGETSGAVSTVTIAAGQSITFAPITGVPAGATVRYYLSIAAGNTATQYTGVQNTGSASQTFTTLPSGAAPPTTSTTTATTVTAIMDTPASPNKIAVWSGNTINGLVQHSRTFDSEWSISNRFGTVMTQDDRNNSYSSHIDKAPDVHLTTTLEHDSFSQGLMADLRNRQTKFVRWIVSGALIEAGFPFRLQMTMPAFLDKPTRKAAGDVYGASYDWIARDDAGFGAIIEFVVDTDQAAL
ncbi:MAG: hypothetical protein LC772_06545 [Chloroflexi bacterium]|nr:hypothetical protein [Chloroflexota bacterium]